MSRIWWLIVFGAACYGFGALSVTADELFGIAQFYGPSGLYYFPIIGPRGLWDSWVYVFTGLAVCLFLSLVSILSSSDRATLARTISVRATGSSAQLG